LLNLEHVVEAEGAIWYPIGISVDDRIVYGWIHSGYVVPDNPLEYIEQEAQPDSHKDDIER